MGTCYYALVASFTDYTLQSEAKNLDTRALLADVKEALTPSDFNLVRLLFMKYDCENLVSKATSGARFNPMGLLTESEIEEELSSPSRFPEPIARVLRINADPEGVEALEAVDYRSFASALFNAYYAMCASSSSQFLRDWADSERTISNLVAATVARGKGVRPQDVIVGSGEIEEQIGRSSLPDFGIKDEVNFAESVIAAVEDEHNLMERERRIDVIKWNIIEDLTTFFYFDINAVLGYLARINIISRWLQINENTGRELLDRMLSRLNADEKIKNTIQ